ncbi:MAG: hypothetical protein KGM24_11560, partial [Elusimicrobia bacterium]|nr:hypothetical protein [Elusimicrobiota bacterium]
AASAPASAVVRPAGPAQAELVRVERGLARYRAAYGEFVFDGAAYVAPRPVEGASGATYVFGRELARRVRRGDPTARRMLELGYELSAAPGSRAPVLAPPPAERLIGALTHAIIAAARRAGLSEDQVILPALVFARRRGGRLEHRLARPGRDAIPSPTDGWRPVRGQSAILPEETFARAVASGRMPFEPSGYYHDVGHLIDFIERPAFMAAQRGLFRAAAERVRAGSSPFGARWSWALQELNEFNIKAAPGRERDWDEVLGPAPSGAPERARFAAKYATWRLARMTAVRRELERRYYALHDTFGGAARDYIFSMHSGPELPYAGLEEARAGRALPEHRARLGFGLNLLNQVPALLTRMRFIEDLLAGRRIAGFHRSRADPTLLKRPALLAAYRAALVEVELQARLAYRLRLTPEKAYADYAARLRPGGEAAYRRSATYRYFRALSKPGDRRGFAFVEADEASR